MVSDFTRRAFLQRGLGGIALAALLQQEALANTPGGWTPPDGIPHFAPKAKSVIWLFMNGGVSHLETFDPKPELDKYAGKTISETPYKSVQDPEKLALARVTVINDANGQQRNVLYPTQIGFKKYGDAGIDVSDWLPNVATCVDDLAIIRSLYTTDDNHGAQTQFHSGRHNLDGEFPTLGAWVHYGLGSLSDEVPQFISMGKREYWNNRDGFYLGPAHDAVPIRVDPDKPLDYAKPQADRTMQEQQVAFHLVDRLNSIRGGQYPEDEALAARMKSYELAFRMQTSVPDVLRFSEETEETRRLYGLDENVTRDFGMQLLAARRFVEKGVRFIQIQHGAGGAGAWDAHGGLRTNHAKNCKAVDKPIAGLIKDLKRRGMLEDTLVVFGTEFGRTPGTQGKDGRDHHIYGFSVWMAGGGLKGGIVHGKTDEIGFHAVEDRHYVTDVHATIMHQLGLDPRRLEVPGHKRLEIDFGHPIEQIIA